MNELRSISVELAMIPILAHLPWHVLLLVDNLTVSELVLQWPPKACDHGKAGKLGRQDTCLPERRSLLFFVVMAGLETSISKDSNSRNGWSAIRSKTSLG